MKAIHVSLTVNVDGQEKTFTANVTTDGNVYEVAKANVSGAATSAYAWLSNLRYGPRGKDGFR